MTFKSVIDTSAEGMTTTPPAYLGTGHARCQVEQGDVERQGFFAVDRRTVFLSQHFHGVP